MPENQRVNEEINATEVRVIADDGAQLGVLAIADAIKAAMDRDLDLVEVAPGATPPVCRIMNFGKFRYAQQKKEHQARKRSHAAEIKELRLGRSINVEQHDFEIKLKKARELLLEGCRVSVFLQLRGRELSHSEIGIQSLRDFITALQDIAKADQSPRQEGKRLGCMLTPLQATEKPKPAKPKPAAPAEAKPASAVAAAPVAPAAPVVPAAPIAAPDAAPAAPEGSTPPAQA